MEESKLTIPRILLSTNQGALSCMIPEHLKFLNFHPGIHFSFAGLVDTRSILSAFSKAANSTEPLRDYFGLKHVSQQFVGKGLQSPKFYLSFDQHGCSSLLGSDKNGNVEVKTEKGKIKLTFNQYIEEVESWKPSFFVGMHEHIDSKSGHKKIKRAARHSLQLLDSLIEEKPVLCKQKLLAPLIYSPDPVHSTKYIAQVRGIIPKIKGFSFLNPEGTAWKDKIQFIESIYQEEEPYTKERCIVLSGQGKPLDIILGSLVGIHSYECRYPFTLAEKGKALLLPNVILQDHQKYSLSQVIQASEKPKDDIILDLYSKEYFQDKDTLMGNQPEEGTHTWEKVTKAYIHHLLDCHEMNGHILLAQHNLKIYGLLLERIDEHMKHGTLLAYARKFILNLKNRSD